MSHEPNSAIALPLSNRTVYLDKMATGISDLSEVRPEHFDVTLNLMLYPQTLLFSNPAAAMACAADAISASAGYPLDALFWCSGE